MTTRKYKKLLMSCGVERNLAEERRKHVAFLRSLNVNLANSSMAEYRAHAADELRFCAGSIRVRRKDLRASLKKITAL